MSRFPLFFALLIFTGLVGLACANGGLLGVPADAVKISDGEVHTLLAQSYSGISDAADLVIRSTDEWAAFWERAHADITPPPPPPHVDFSGRMVVAAAMGSRPSGGFGIEIESVHSRGADLYVHVRERRPAANCMVTAAITAPVTAVSVPRTDGQVRFIRTETVHRC
jgi:hypothetical protein